MLQAEARRKMFAQRLHTIALSSMVSGGDEGDTGLLCDMHVLF